MALLRAHRRAHHTAALSPRASPPVCTPTLFALSTIFGITPILSFRHYPALIRVQPFLHCISPIRSFWHHPALIRVQPFLHRFRTSPPPAPPGRARALDLSSLRRALRAALSAAPDPRAFHGVARSLRRCCALTAARISRPRASHGRAQTARALSISPHRRACYLRSRAA